MGFPLIEQSRHQLQFWGINSAIWTHGCGDCPVIGWKQNDSIAAEGTPNFSTSVSSWRPVPEGVLRFVADCFGCKLWWGSNCSYCEKDDEKVEWLDSGSLIRGVSNSRTDSNVDGKY